MAAWADFVIGGLYVPVMAKNSFEQVYERIAARAELTMADGTTRIRERWAKWRTTLSSDGWTPGGLSALPTDQALVLKCAAPLRLLSASRVISVPTRRRTDKSLRGFALTDGPGYGEKLVETPVALAGDTATLTAVTGALGYCLDYFPQFTGFLEPSSERCQAARRTYDWSITFTEQTPE